MNQKETSNKKDGVAVVAFIMGIASALFFDIGVLPMATVIVSAAGITRTEKSGSGRWMAVTGLVLGIVYSLLSLSHYGHLGI